MHNSLAAIPLALMTAERVTNCYDLMDAAYCSGVLREHSRSLGSVGTDHRPVDETTHVAVAKQAEKSSKRSVGTSQRSHP